MKDPQFSQESSFWQSNFPWQSAAEFKKDDLTAVHLRG